MKKYLVFYFFLVLCLQGTSQSKLEPVELNDVAYPVLSIAKSNQGNYIFLTLYGGRFLLYDVSTTNGQLTKSSILKWKNFNVNDFERGGNAFFSEDGNSLLIVENNIHYTGRVRIKPVRIYLLDVLTGTIKYEENGVNSAQLINKDSQLLLGYDDGFKVVDILTKKVIREQKIEDCELVALNHSENTLAVAFDPNRKEFKKIESVGDNRKELKYAIKNKKLVAFYDFSTFKKLGTCSDELDVVITMQYTPSDDYLILFTKNRTMETTRGKEQNNFIRIRQSDYKVDNVNFYYSSSEPSANFAFNKANNYFMFNDNDGFFEWKRKVSIYDFNQLDKRVAYFMFQGRPKRKNLFSTAFCLTSGQSMIVANGTKVINWNFAQQPEYTDYVEQQDPDATSDSISVQLQRAIDNPESSLMKAVEKKQIKGLYIFDLTIMKGGEVTSIYASSDDKTNIPMQNALKEILIKQTFDVKIPKNERVKIRHIFNF